MKRREFLIAVLSVPVIGQAQSLKDMAGALKDPLISMLSSKLGVTDKQASGGMGSMLTLAKENLGAADYSKLTSVLPQASSYLDSAKQQGAVTGPVSNMAGLNKAFAKLGIKPEVANQFVPLVTDYLGKIGGPTVKGLLDTVFK
jgi:hypothetical protein